MGPKGPAGPSGPPLGPKGPGSMGPKGPWSLGPIGQGPMGPIGPWDPHGPLVPWSLGPMAPGATSAGALRAPHSTSPASTKAASAKPASREPLGVDGTPGTGVGLSFKLVLGQSSLPIWIPGTIEFIWAGGIPLYPHHKIISSQNYLFRDPKIDPKVSPGQNVERGVPNFDQDPQIHPRA